MRAAVVEFDDTLVFREIICKFGTNSDQGDVFDRG